ncbi:hypothetical protein [Janthinobacterium sp. GW458P]|uniref:hypothetical protein n=1 Tax=Janthinobacterium sp. GW458P TaxID=1981504 RepID=UPI001555EAE0|nr:hypothetical protein [Janthinobacterium sp. GW458P]
MVAGIKIKLLSLSYRHPRRLGDGVAARISISTKKQHLSTILKKIISFTAAALPRKGEKVR